MLTICYFQNTLKGRTRPCPGGGNLTDPRGVGEGFRGRRRRRTPRPPGGDAPGGVFEPQPGHDSGWASRLSPARAAAWLAGWSGRRRRGPRGANRGARLQQRGRRAAGPPQLLAATSASPGSMGGREGASGLPQQRAGPPARVWLGRCAAAPGVAAGRARRWWERWAAREERRRCHRRQLRNMAARRLLGGKAGLPRAPRLPLPAGRPRAAV